MKKILIFMPLFLLSMGVSQACSFMPREYSEIYSENDVVFLGQINEEERKEGTFSFNVLETLKGTDIGSSVVVIDPMVGTSCQKWGYEVGKYWVVGMNKNNEISDVNLDKSFDTQEAAKSFYLKNSQVVVEEKTTGGVKPPKPEQVVQQPVEGMKGPTGPPNIMGPTSPPPTRAEVENMKAKEQALKDREGLGFWGRVWDWIVGLFG